MKERVALCAVLLTLVATTSCRRQPAEDDAAVREALAAKPTTEVLAEAAAAAYEPPADGKLGEEQLEMYLAVRERERRIREVAERGGEYRWVADRVMEALLADLKGRLEARLTEGRERYLELLEAQREKVTEPDQLAKLDGQIAEARREMVEAEGSAVAAAEPADEALAHNAALVERYRERIEAVLTPDERFAVGEWEGEEPAEPPAGEAEEEP